MMIYHIIFSLYKAYLLIIDSDDKDRISEWVHSKVHRTNMLKPNGNSKYRMYSIKHYEHSTEGILKYTFCVS